MSREALTHGGQEEDEETQGKAPQTSFTFIPSVQLSKS